MARWEDPNSGSGEFFINRESNDTPDAPDRDFVEQSPTDDRVALTQSQTAHTWIVAGT